MIEIVWFKRDLRLSDHGALLKACESGRPIVPLYIFEPELWQQPELSGRHFDFLIECLKDLDHALVKRGAGLIVKIGEAVDVLSRLHAEHGIAALHAHEETGLMWTFARDKAVRAFTKKTGIAMFEQRQHGVWRGFHNRNGWAKRWDDMMAMPPMPAPKTIPFAPITSDPWPSKSDLAIASDLCPQRQIGGRIEGLACLEGFLSTRGRFYRKAMSNPVDGAVACSRISPHLAFGTVSMREALHSASRALVHHQQTNDSFYAGSISSFIARLHWHCHFIQKLEDQPDIELLNLHPGYTGLRPIGPDQAALAQAWIEGRTGFPFVDACMRSLAATGWLNFRMRAMVMSFSSYHLWQDWRLPSQLLARQFTDFEPGIHFSQAQMQSGTTGINTARIYNPIKQSIDQDPSGEFIRTWVTELRHLPIDLIHEPWRASSDLLAQSARSDGTVFYPDRLVDHEVAAAYARTQIYTVRADKSHKAAAGAIQNQHGSRKSGLAQVGRRPKARKQKVMETAQTSFDF
jgi:deoxyribodipyrimidine photo-lyase